MSGGVVRRDPLQQSGSREIKRCNTCHVDYVIQKGAALPCTHNNKGGTDGAVQG